MARILPHAGAASVRRCARCDFGLSGCPRWQVIDRDDLPHLADRLRLVLIR
jgi:hypothetical protein